MFKDVEFHKEEFGGEHGITAYKDGRVIGILEYGAPEKDTPISLDAIEASPEMPGVGNELLRQFALNLGKGKIIEGSIIHEGTVNWLARNGFFNGVGPDFSRTFSSPTTLNRFPFRRFLSRANVELISLTTSYNLREFENGETDSPYEVSFVAKTK